MRFLTLLLLPTFSWIGACSQTMDFEKYDPPSTLIVPTHPLTKAKFPFIDVHNHQFNMNSQNLQELVTPMNKMNMAVMVNLSGVGGDKLKQSVKNIQTNFPKRFIVFTNIDFAGIGEPNWTKEAVAKLEADVKNGANGLKIYKSLGFSVKDKSGKRVTVDDPRLDAIWHKCGELGIPVIIHTADPKPFWDPLDENNERWLELKTHAGRKRSDTDPAPF